MRFTLLFHIFLVLLHQTDSHYTESHDDVLLQCSETVKNMPRRREKHICEKENFDDDFDYQIVNMEAPYSGK